MQTIRHVLDLFLVFNVTRSSLIVEHSHGTRNIFSQSCKLQLYENWNLNVKKDQRETK